MGKVGRSSRLLPFSALSLKKKDSKKGEDGVRRHFVPEKKWKKREEGGGRKSLYPFPSMLNCEKGRRSPRRHIILLKSYLSCYKGEEGLRKKGSSISKMCFEKFVEGGGEGDRRPWIWQSLGKKRGKLNRKEKKKRKAP